MFWAETLVEVGGGWCGDWGGGKLAGYLSAEPQPTSNHTLSFGIREIQFITHTKRNRINRIREIHGGRWCGRKVACYQLSGCCGRSSQATLQSEHHALPFLFHTTTLLLCHKLDFYKQYFPNCIFTNCIFTPHLAFPFSTPPQFTLLLCHTVNQHKTNPTHYLLNFACILLILLNYLLYHLKDKNIILAI